MHRWRDGIILLEKIGQNSERRWIVATPEHELPRAFWAAWEQS
jgi:hypothetical protein